jgi:hypothetical protein
VLVAFLVSAGLVVAPQISALAHHFTTPPQNGGTETTLAPADLQMVLSYAQQMRSDDSLVQVRAGVFAKRSNVEGVQVGSQRVYYDLVPHQSYGPLRSGRVDESQINVLSRSQSGDTLILVYTLR